METCPKCKKNVSLEELVRYVSVLDNWTHICTNCAIQEGQPDKIEPYRKSYNQNNKMFFKEEGNAK